MKHFLINDVLIFPQRAKLAAAVLFAVPILLWYQSSRYDLGTDKGYSRFNIDHRNDNFARNALSPTGQDRAKNLQRYVRTLQKAGYRTAALTWLKFGAEQGLSDQIIRSYADALEANDPASAEEWRNKAAGSRKQEQRR